MKPQEDIGSFIKTKLQSAEKASKEDTWDRIQSSLEKRKKKKRAIFFLKWSSIIALLVISGLLIVYSNSATPSIETTVNPESETSTLTVPLKSENVSTTLSDKEEINALDPVQKEMSKNNDTQNGYSEKDNVMEENTMISKTKTNTVDNSTSNSTETSQKQPTEIVSTTPVSSNNDISIKDNSSKSLTTNKNTKEQAISNTIDQDTIVNRNDVPVTHTTKKIYYYYNSKNGQEISSTEKSVIDSIVKANEPKKDSLKID